MMPSHRLVSASAIVIACLQLVLRCDVVVGYISPTHQKFRSSCNQTPPPQHATRGPIQPDSCEPTLFSHPQTDSLRKAREARLGLAANRKSSNARLYDPVVDGNQYRAAQSYSAPASRPYSSFQASPNQVVGHGTAFVNSHQQQQQQQPRVRVSGMNNSDYINMEEERKAHYYNMYNPSSSYSSRPNNNNYQQREPKVELVDDEDDNVFMHGYKDPTSIFEAVEADHYSSDVAKSTKYAIHKHGFIDAEVDSTSNYAP